MLISVRQLSGKQTDLEVEPHSSVGDLKRRMQDAEGLDPSLMRIVFAGKQLEDATSLQTAGVPKGAVVHLLMRLGQGEPKEQPDDGRLQRLLDIYEITIAEAAEFAPLREYEITFVLDDSGSMNITDPGAKQTRWQELRETTRAMIGFATYFNRGGTTVNFLNRDPIHGIEDPDDNRLLDTFRRPPAGTTPLTHAVQKVVEQSRAPHLLMVIATDGEPDGGSRGFMAALRRIIADKSRNVRFQIMACTDDDDAVGWLNDFDLEFAEVDVCDDYQSERKEVLQTGRMPRFTRGDWVMKALLGPVSQKFDKWDELSPRRRGRGAAAGGGAQPAGNNIGAVLAVIFAFVLFMWFVTDD
eukprot:TRINITY_DN65459_c0_g1_i1.p1 TRINITY_DN65459_c0_g1~~TRINITY_DN65459_c0_g1_i1.p1  ORF type:complete len:390 (+),score=142.45 TRINITY_DN65459_c0_g1_i1:106-1170(+)